MTRFNTIRFTSTTRLNQGAYRKRSRWYCLCGQHISVHLHKSGPCGLTNCLAFDSASNPEKFEAACAEKFGYRIEDRLYLRNDGQGAVAIIFVKERFLDNAPAIEKAWKVPDHAWAGVITAAAGRNVWMGEQDRALTFHRAKPVPPPRIKAQPIKKAAPTDITPVRSESRP